MGRRRPLAVVFDEFQALIRLDVWEELMAVLRGIILLQPEVTYFYLGSIRNLMDRLFNDPEQPFFKSAASVSVGPIERMDYATYLGRRFQSGGRRMTAPAACPPGVTVRRWTGTRGERKQVGTTTSANWFTE